MKKRESDLKRFRIRIRFRFRFRMKNSFFSPLIQHINYLDSKLSFDASASFKKLATTGSEVGAAFLPLSFVYNPPTAHNPRLPHKY